MSQCGQLFAREHFEDSAECLQQKEKTMDRNFYNQKRAEEHQREVSQELANRKLLSGLQREPLTAKQARRLMLRLAPAVIILTILLVLSLLL